MWYITVIMEAGVPLQRQYILHHIPAEIFILNAMAIPNLAKYFMSKII